MENNQLSPFLQKAQNFLVNLEDFRFCAASFFKEVQKISNFIKKHDIFVSLCDFNSYYNQKLFDLGVILCELHYLQKHTFPL